MNSLRQQIPPRHAHSYFTPLSRALLQHKCACGDLAGFSGQCAECSRKRVTGLQAKLAISDPGDEYEQEADRVAEQVMRMSPVAVSRQQSERMVQPVVQRRVASGVGSLGEAPPIVHEVLNSPGQSLDPATRDFFEPRFGYDFGSVRVHSGAVAAQSARVIHADAYTVGHDIVVGSRFTSGTRKGCNLIAHELAHVVQQRGGAKALYRQQAAVPPKQVPRPDPVPGLGPARTEYVEDLIKNKDFQGAVDTLVHFKVMDYEIDFDLLADKKMTYDPNLKASDATTSMPRWDYLSTPQKAEPARVKIGPSAFASVAYLYSVIMHEYQHVLWQQTLAHQQISHRAHTQGYESPDEVEASAWELLHATETGLARMPDEIAQRWEKLNESFWKLDPQAQASERQLVIRALQKATELIRGSQQKLVPFSSPSKGA